MSLHRTALRLAAVSALTNNFTPPFPTIGEGRIFDSRLDPREGFSREDAIPTAVVYADSDKGKPLNGQNGGPPFRREVDLVIEIMLGAMDEGAPDAGFALAVTDAELAAMLDLFEHQVRAALFGGVNVWSRRFLDVTKRCTEFTSRPYITSEAGIRFAARELTFTIEMTDDCLPGVTLTADAPTLPPLLAAFDAAVQADTGQDGEPKGYASAVIDLIRVGAPQATQLTPLQRIVMTEQKADGTPDIVAIVDDLDS